MIPSLYTGNITVDRAFRIAAGDIMGNIQKRKGSTPFLDPESPVLLAGLDYDKPWTRDASFHSFFGLSLYLPEVAEATLLSVLSREEGGLVIGGQYWDAVIWVTGAWRHYLITGKKDFLKTAREASANTLLQREREEYDTDGLFRGPALLGDGISAYPAKYTNNGTSSCILDWPNFNPEKRHPKGVGIPMKALSTNCLYYGAYQNIQKMERELGKKPEEHWNTMSTRLRDTIHGSFWSEELGRYGYLTDDEGFCDYQECLGHAFALLTGIVPEDKAVSLIKNTYITPHGIPCVWPSFPRYRNKEKDTYGRHSGTVWPHGQAAWAIAAASHGAYGHLSKELKLMAEHASRDEQFLELYHPTQGIRYAGEQEYTKWKSCSRQSWCATGFIGTILFGVCGIDLTPPGIAFQPFLPGFLNELYIEGIHIRGKSISVTIKRRAADNITSEPEFFVNGQVSDPFIRYEDASESLNIVCLL